jgi:hypothetical protein
VLKLVKKAFPPDRAIVILSRFLLQIVLGDDLVAQAGHRAFRYRPVAPVELVPRLRRVVGAGKLPQAAAHQQESLR